MPSTYGKWADEDYMADLRAEENWKKRNANRWDCTDGMCGADDCTRCGGRVDEDEEE